MNTQPESPQPQAVGELERCRRELERADQVLACLRRALGHDMANHLVAIQGLLRILEMEEGDHLGAAGKDYVRRIGNVSERVHILVSSLAAICRGGKDTHLAERLSLTGVAQEVAAELNQLFPNRRIEYHFPDAPFQLTASRAALRHVLLQLMRNAVQATGEGQPVRIDIGATDTAACREFWIADTGRGLAADRLQELQEFFSGKPWPGPGNALGLMIVRQIVERLGGQVRVESERGRGTVFTISLAP
jgi:signal transduction histidine kinase